MSWFAEAGRKQLQQITTDYCTSVLVRTSCITVSDGMNKLLFDRYFGRDEEKSGSSGDGELTDGMIAQRDRGWG